MTNEQLEQLCVAAARQSDCSKVHFGALALDENGDVQGVGFNHIPDMAVGCGRDCVGGIRRGVRSGTMVERCFAIHAEQHAILRAGGRAHEIVVLGVLPDDSRFDNGGGFYCTVCARIMRVAGVEWVRIWTRAGWRRLTIREAWQQSYSVATMVAEEVG